MTETRHGKIPDRQRAAPRNFSILFSCYFATFSILFYLFFILPHSGLDFSDSGLALYSGLFLVKPYISFDWIGLIRPSFFNAFFIFFGIKSIYFLKLAFSISIIFSVGLLLLSIEKRLWILIPIASALALYNEPLTLGIYENIPIIYLMTGISFFFFSRHKEGILKHFLIIFSALFIALSSASNISVMFAIFFAILFLCAIYRSKHALLLFFEFTLFFTFIAYIYISFVGANNFSQLFNHEHSSELLKTFFNRSLSVGFLLFKVILLSIIIKKASAFFCTEKIKNNSTLWPFTVSIILILFLTPFFKYLFSFYYFSGEIQWLSSFSLLILIFAFSSIINFANFKSEAHIKLIYIFIVGIAYYVCQAVTTDNPILLPLSYCCGLFSVIFLSFFYFCHIESQNKSDKKLLSMLFAVVSVLLALGIYIQINFSYGNGKTLNNTDELKIPLLNNVYTTPEKKKLITYLYQVYTSQNCNKKAFIAFYDLPVLYYLFQRTAPLNESWIQSWGDSNGFPRTMVSDENILEWLQKNNTNLCVFYSTGLANKTSDENIKAFLRNNNMKTFKIHYEGIQSNIWAESAPTEYEIFIK